MDNRGYLIGWLAPVMDNSEKPTKQLTKRDWPPNRSLERENPFFTGCFLAFPTLVRDGQEAESSLWQVGFCYLVEESMNDYPVPSINTLEDWDGKSDLILIAYSESGGVEAKVCPANVIHHVLNQYREFINTHQLKLDTTLVDDQLFVVMHFEPSEVES